MDQETVTADPLDANFAYAVWDRLTGSVIANNPLGTGPAVVREDHQPGESWEDAQQIYDPVRTRRPSRTRLWSCPTTPWSIP